MAESRQKRVRFGEEEDRQRQSSRKHRRDDEEHHEHRSRDVRPKVDLDTPLTLKQLEEMFFGPKQHFQLKTEELKEFPEFYEKYVRAQQALAAQKRPPPPSNPIEKTIDIPSEYHQRYRLNFSIITPPLPSHLLHHESQVKDYRQAIHFFEDFLQKKRFTQLQKSIKGRLELPISAYQQEIVRSVKENSVVIVAGDTGCGKSTQVPQYLMASGFRRVACTQPRRIACHALARRVSFESLNVFGNKIAYQVRFDTTFGGDTRILFLTEGLLMRYLLSDPLLMRWDVIVIDEVHERHITSDFLLAVLKGVISKRPSLKLVLMSATINAEMFSNYFHGAPIIKVGGRMYPVAIEYVPTEEDLDLLNDKFYQERLEKGGTTSVVAKPMKQNSAPILKIMERIDQEYPSDERGDLLIFFSGINEITFMADELKPYAAYTKRWIILLLHSSLSVEEQDKVFDIAPDGVRKCILSTNIAETSVTIDGIRFIIDTGRVKEMGHDAESQMMRLQEFWISQASAQQRAGRAGRTGPGKCFRMYSQKEFNHLNAYAVPEIMRVPLTSLVLQIKALNIGDPRVFDLVQRPPLDVIEGSIDFLKSHGALTHDERITPMGFVLSLLPVDFIIAKMLLLSIVFDMVDPVLTLASSLSVQSPFVRLVEDSLETMQNRHAFDSDHGDPLTMLNVVDEWIRIKASENSSKKWSQRHGLEEQRLYEMLKLKRQFESILNENKLLSEKDNSSFFEKRRQNKEQVVDGRVEKQQLIQQARIMQSSRKRKVLRFDESISQAEASKETEVVKSSQKGVDLMTLDIRDLDFQLTNDINELQANAEAHKRFSMWEINLLKLIVCSGLYPNIAIADDGNMNRKDSDLVFHTAHKRFVVLHPTSVFNVKPELVAPQRIADGTRTAEVLCYLQLLETTKPFVMNLLRLPALQVLLLFCRKIETDGSGTRLIFDDWLEINFMDAQVAAQQLVIGHRFRTLWRKLLDQKIATAARRYLPKSTQSTFADLSKAFYSEESTAPTVPLPELLPSWILQIRKEALIDASDISSVELSKKMCEFLESRVNYRLNVLSPEDTKEVYEYEQQPPSAAQTESPRKLGFQVTEYLRYASVKPLVQIDERTSGFHEHMLKWFKCPTCGIEIMVNRSDLLKHLDSCQQMAQKQQAASSSATTTELQVINADSNSVAVQNRKPYTCPECHTTFQFTPTEALKHRRTHQAP